MVRFKNRYLLVETVWRDGTQHVAKLSSRALAESIKSSVQANFGDMGSASVMQSLQGTSRRRFVLLSFCRSLHPLLCSH